MLYTIATPHMLLTESGHKDVNNKKKSSVKTLR